MSQLRLFEVGTRLYLVHPGVVRELEAGYYIDAVSEQAAREQCAQRWGACLGARLIGEDYESD